MADDALNALAVSGQLPQEFLRPSGDDREPGDYSGEDAHHHKVQPNTEPSEHVLQTWRTADCVCFDVGCECGVLCMRTVWANLIVCIVVCVGGGS